MNARRDVGDLLAAQLDAIEEDLKQRARPYALLAEYRRRVEVAEAFVAELPCQCGIDECIKHVLERVLAGDE